MGCSIFSICSTESSQITTIPLSTASDKTFSLSTTLTWQEFGSHQHNISLNKNKWVWTALITIRSKKAMKLQQINFQWSGEKIGSINASLYRKARTEQDLIPIEEYLVCDGTWNAAKQQITFVLDEKIIAINEYYLVLSVPKTFAKKLRVGQFTLAHTDSLKLVSL